MPDAHDAPAPSRIARRPVPQHLDTDALSAYLDDRLEPDTRSVAASHLAICPDCRRELDELGTTVALLHALPQYRPRRSFQLGPAYAKPVHASRLAGLLPFLPTLRTATAVVALLLALVTAADVLIDAEDAQRPATERAIVDEDRAPPVDAREPTGREPLPAGDAGPGAAGAPAGEAPGEAAAGEGGQPAPAAPAAEGRPAGEPAAQDGQSAGLAVDEAADQTAGGEGATSLEQASGQAGATREARSDEGDGLSTWQVAQIGLGLVLAGLVAALFALQRLANRARRLDPGF